MVLRGTVARCLTATVLAFALAGCTNDPVADPSNPPDDATVVVGTGVCEITTVSDEMIDGVNVVVERFVCTDAMSDSRVSGTEDLVIETRVADPSAGGTWTTRSALLTNDQGTWRGTAHGVVDFTGVLPFAKGLAPYNYGEAHYVGAGAYDGLEYHWYISGSNREAGVAGWITTSG